MKGSLLLLSIFSLPVFAGPIQLRDHRWTLTDISEKGLTREQLYNSMNRQLVRVQDSICSNRAEVWAHDFKKTYNIKTAKVFLFYTEKTFDGWWYHAANVVNERGQFQVLDAGFPWMFKGPRTLNDWFKEFTKQTECREIRKSEKDLIRLIFNGESFPSHTQYGDHKCYYAIAPEGYWTPAQLAKGLLGEDEDGRDLNFSRSELLDDEVFEACMEVTTSPLGWAWGSGVKRCNYFIKNGSN